MHGEFQYDCAMPSSDANRRINGFVTSRLARAASLSEAIKIVELEIAEDLGLYDEFKDASVKIDLEKWIIISEDIMQPATNAHSGFTFYS